MFENIGKTLESISKFLFWASVILGLILVIYGLSLIFMHDYMSFSEVLRMTEMDYARGLAEEYEFLTEPYEGLQLITWGILLIISSVGDLAMYAFASIVENVQKIVKIQEKIEQRYPSQNKLGSTTKSTGNEMTPHSLTFDDLPEL